MAIDYNTQMKAIIEQIARDIKIAGNSGSGGGGTSVSNLLGTPSDQDLTNELFYYFGYKNDNLIIRQNKKTGENKKFTTTVYITNWNNKENLVYN